MIATTIEQSIHLLELGLKVETADMFWLVTSKPRLHVLTEDLSKYDSWEDYPAWSLEALLAVIPHTGFDGIELSNYSDEETVWTGIFHWNAESSPIRLGYTPLEAVYEIVCWLLENGYVKKEE